MLSDEWTMVETLINLEDGADAMRGKEIDFIEDIYNDGDGESYDLSEKQSDWLKAIHARCVDGVSGRETQRRRSDFEGF